MGFHEQFNLVKVEVIIQVDLWISFLNREIRNDVYGELQIQKNESYLFCLLPRIFKSIQQKNRRTKVCGHRKYWYSLFSIEVAKQWVQKPPIFRKTFRNYPLLSWGFR